MKEQPEPAPARGPAASRREMILAMVGAAESPLSILAIARRLDVHANTVRFHLEALAADGRVERVLGDITGPGRPPTLYRTRSRMDRTGRSNYRLIAAMLAGHLAGRETDAVSTAVDLGRSWGPFLAGPPAPGTTLTRAAALTRLTGVLDDLGFDPEAPDGSPAEQIRLRHCPFLDLVDDHPDIICSLHLGLMQGTMTQLTEAVEVKRLDRFVEPNLCIAHLADR